MSSQVTALTQILKNKVNVDNGYRHTAKFVDAQETLTTDNAILKWYALYPQERPIADEITSLAKTCLTSRPLAASGLGFVVLHKCGTDFYFLIVATWNNNNELWQTVFYKDGEKMSEFAIFPRNSEHLPTFCVWELVPVWHEQQVWVRFLSSARDEAAAQIWLNDRYSGPA